MLLRDTDLSTPPSALFARTGWSIEPRGACRGDVCVPLQDAHDIESIAARLGMAVVDDPEHGLRAIGPSSVGGRALETATAPDLELPYATRDGVWRLADQRGRRTVIVAWAPW